MKEAQKSNKEEVKSERQGSKREQVLPDKKEGEERSGATDSGRKEVSGQGGGTPKLRELLLPIRQDFKEVTGLEVDRVSALVKKAENWRAEVEVVELARIPHSTDVIGTYEVTADAGGHLESFERIRRFYRSEGNRP
jgi:hypothetical protein